MKTKEIYITRLLYFMLLISFPTVLMSVSRAFFTGWEHVYAMHLAFIPLFALTLYGNFSFRVKATILIAIFNLAGFGNMFTYSMWGMGATCFLYGILLSLFTFGLRGAILNILALALLGYFYFFETLGVPTLVNLSIGTFDVLVQFAVFTVLLITHRLGYSQISATWVYPLPRQAIWLLFQALQTEKDATPLIVY